MPIDPAALVQNVSALGALDPEQDLGRAMQQITSAAKALMGVDGAGLMLADERGVLGWATASDQRTQVIEEGEERLGQGPCVIPEGAGTVNPSNGDRLDGVPFPS